MFNCVSRDNTSSQYIIPVTNLKSVKHIASRSTDKFPFRFELEAMEESFHFCAENTNEVSILPIPCLEALMRIIVIR